MTLRKLHKASLRALVARQVAKAWGTTGSVRSDLKKATSASIAEYMRRWDFTPEKRQQYYRERFVKNILDPIMGEYTRSVGDRIAVNYRAMGCSVSDLPVVNLFGVYY